MSKTVLIVEDEPQVRNILARQLRSNGYVPTMVGSGEEALSAVLSQNPDFILLDVSLPGIDGFETLRRLRSSSATAKTPVLMLTGRGMPEDIIRGYASGVVYYIPKPYKLEELLRGLQLAEKAAAADRESE